MIVQEYYLEYYDPKESLISKKSMLYAYKEIYWTTTIPSINH